MQKTRTACEARVNFVNLGLFGVRDGEITSTLVLFSSEAYFDLSVHMNSQNNNLSMILNEAPLHDVQARTWCAANATTIVEPMPL